jgi:hypothetical protein
VTGGGDEQMWRAIRALQSNERKRRGSSALLDNGEVSPRGQLRIKGEVTATAPNGSTTSLSPAGTVSTAEDGTAVRLADGVAEVQPGPDEPWVPLEQVILDQVPHTDGLPPVSPPDVQLIEGNGDVLLAITPVVGPDEDPIIAFTVYVDGDYRLTAFSTTISIVGLPYDADTTFTVTQSDADGEGPPSAPVTGRPQKIDADDLAQTVIDSLDNADVAYEIAIGAARIVYAGTDPVDDPDKDKDGDTWFRYTGGNLVGQWRHDGTDWQQVVIDQQLIGELNAAKITTGFLNVALLIQAGAIDAEKINVQSLKTPLANIGVLVANDVYTSGGLHITKAGSLAAIDENATDGRRQYDSSGTLRLSFPMDPSADAPYLFDGNLVARALVVKGPAAFEGTGIRFSRNSTATLDRGTTAPTSAPIPATPAWAAAGLAAAPADGGWFDGTDWLFLAPATTAYGRPRLARMTSAGAVTYTALTGLPAGSSTADDGYRDHRGVVKIGTDYYVLVGRTRVKPNSFISSYVDVTLYRLNSSFALVSSIVLSTGDSFEGWAGTDIAVDAGQIAIATRGSSTTTVQNYTTALATTGSPVTIGGTTGGRFLVGNFDFGSKRYIFTASGASADFRSFDATGVAQPAENFSATSGTATVFSATGIGWDGAKFIVWYEGFPAGGSSSAPQPPVKSSTRTTSLTLSAAITWIANRSAINPKPETTVGPDTTVTLPARAGAVTFTVPAPDDDGTADSPSASRLYLGLSASTLKLQGSPFVKTITVVDPVVNTGTAPPAANSFPDGVAARLQSASGATYMSGDGKVRAADFGAGPANQIQTDALGNGRVGAMYFSTTLNGFGSTTAHMGGTVLGQLADPVSVTDAANRRFVETSMESYKATVSPDSTATTNTNQVGGAIISVTCPGPAAVYFVMFFADLRLNTQTISAAINLMIDGVASGGQMALGGPGGLIIPAAKGWVVTGLNAGTRTFRIQHANFGGNGSSTITGNSDLIVLRRK